MTTENRSQSYLVEREAVRKWLLETREGHFATELARREAPNDNLAPFFDDDKWLNWADLYREYKEAIVLAANCREARETARLTMQSRNTLGIPAHGPSQMLRFFSPPLSHVLRRQVEMQDPDYWNDIRNVLREALLYPEYTCVPVSLIRAELESHLPKGTKVTVTKEGIVERQVTIPG
jgi:hypothetical protein